MKIAIITGASSGLGVDFALEVDKQRADIDEIWLVARRKDRLEELAAKLSKKTRVLSLDITSDEALEELSNVLEEEKPDIRLLIGNAGFGKLGFFGDLSAQDSKDMIRLNCEGLTVITRLCFCEVTL